ncbi:hypothetical protein DM49_2342 [Burkholderia mallei]|nr:hypothetical protein DM49_2342 [Burkholderia mallei]KOT20111.1 hypothetical protein DM52_859 [Burkholderia mallei]
MVVRSKPAMDDVFTIGAMLSRRAPRRWRVKQALSTRRDSQVDSNASPRKRPMVRNAAR